MHSQRSAIDVVAGSGSHFSGDAALLARLDLQKRLVMRHLGFVGAFVLMLGAGNMLYGENCQVSCLGPTFESLTSNASLQPSVEACRDRCNSYCDTLPGQELSWCTFGPSPSSGGACCNDTTFFGCLKATKDICDLFSGDHLGEFTGCEVTSSIGVGETCTPPVPTVSEWGLVVIALMLLVGAKVYFNRRRVARA